MPTPAPPLSAVPPDTMPSALTIPILTATSRFVVVEKPPGMLSVPGKGPDKADCVVSRIRAMFPAAIGPLVATGVRR